MLIGMVLLVLAFFLVAAVIGDRVRKIHYQILSEVNLSRPKDDQESEYFWHFFKYQRLIKAHEKLYPESRIRSRLAFLEKLFLILLVPLGLLIVSIVPYLNIPDSR